MRSIGAVAGLLATALMAGACNGSDEPPPGGAATSPPQGGTTASPPQGGISASPPGASIGSPGSGQRPPATGQGCNPEPAQFAVGRVATPALIESAREAAGARMVRVLRPDMAVTQEYSPDRLNLLVDDGGVVREVTCW